MKNNKRFSIDVIIVTKDRYENLLRCFFSILANSEFPDKLIIVDNSKNLDRNYCRQIKKIADNFSLPIEYKIIRHCSVSYARFISLKLASSDLVAFIDDDQIATANWVAGARKIFSKHSSKKNIVGIGGLRYPFYPNNYWNKVWQAIENSRYKRNKKITFIPTGNSVYQLSFLKKHNINFDKDFSGAYEDVIFCADIVESDGKLVFDKSMVVFDGFRNTFFLFAKQWFNYGKGTAEFNKVFLKTMKIITFLILIFQVYLDAIKSIQIDRKYIKKVGFGNFCVLFFFSLGFFIYSFILLPILFKNRAKARLKNLNKHE